MAEKTDYLMIPPQELNLKPTMEKMGQCVCFVDATKIEREYLILKYADKTKGVDWSKESGTSFFRIGYIGDTQKHPVSLGVTFDKLNGQLVGFYRAYSRYADWELIEAWLEAFFPAKRVNCDEFQQCVALVSN